MKKSKSKQSQKTDKIRNEYDEQQIQKISSYLEQCTQIFAESYQTDFAQVSMFGDFIKQNKIPQHGFETNFATILAYHGWFIFASGWGGFMPKLHQQRCLLTLDTWDCQKQFQKLTQSNKEKGTKKDFSNKSLKRQMKKVCQSDKYYIAINQNFDEAMLKTNKFQEKNQGCTWIEDRLVQLLQDIKDKPIIINGVVIQAMSWEVRLKENNELIAADIGYQVGGIYASMSGFSDRKYPGMGFVQLLAQGCILKKMGFNMWDFGMSMQYKLDFGAKDYPRKNYLMRQKIAKTIKINSLDQNNKIQLQPQQMPLNSIQEFQNIKEQIFNNFNYKNKRSKQIWDQIREIENKIPLQEWNQEIINNWLNLRFQQKNQESTLYQFNKFEDLQTLEDVFKVLKIKNKSKNIVKIASRLQKKKSPQKEEKQQQQK